MGQKEGKSFYQPLILQGPGKDSFKESKKKNKIPEK